MDNYIDIGYSVYGPILQDFTNWIADTRKIQQLDIILLASRDGYVLQESLQHIQCPSTYFFISRKAAVIPLLQYFHNLNDICNLYKSWPRTIYMNHILDRLGLDNVALDNFNLTIQEYWYSIDDILHDSRIQHLYEYYKSDINLNSKEQGKLLEKYLGPYLNKRVGFVDFGSGTIIESLELFCLCKKLPITWVSLYFQGHSTDTYLNLDEHPRIKAIFRFSYMFIELFFTAPHPSVKGYILENQIVKPLFECPNVEREHIFIRTVELHKGAIRYIYDNKGSILNIHNAFDRFICYFGIPLNFVVKQWKHELIEADSIVELLSSHGKFIERLKNSLWLSGTLRLLYVPRLIVYSLISAYWLLYAIKK